jgi:predicted esterase
MAMVSSREARVWAIVYLVAGLFSWPFEVRASEPEVFEEGAEGPGILAYPPRDPSETQPVTVMLHGMCSEPERACRHFANTVNERGWLLCPRATQRCESGGSTWRFKGFERDVEAGIARVRERHPGRLDEREGRTLVGFSLGAFRALSLAQSTRDTYPRVILIGAKIYPDARLLARGGVERLLLAAGDYDMMSAHMRGRYRVLARQGFPVAFQSYGRVGHAFPGNFSDLLERALDWVQGQDVALTPP